MKRTKDATLTLSASLIAMSVMFSTWQAKVTAETLSDDVTLKFEFPARQQFSLTFRNERLMGANLILVEGVEPTTQAMTVIAREADINTIELFSGLESNGILRVQVKGDDGFSLDGSHVELADIALVDKTFAEILRYLLSLKGKPGQNLGDVKGVETLRAQLATQYRPQPQTQAKSQKAA